MQFSRSRARLAMSKRLDLPTVDRHLLLYKEDWDWLKTKFGAAIGVNQAIRDIVHARVRALRAKAIARLDDPATPAGQDVEDQIIEMLGVTDAKDATKAGG